MTAALFDLDDLQPAPVDLVDSDQAAVQCLTCQLLTTVAALQGRGELVQQVPHGPGSIHCARWADR